MVAITGNDNELKWKNYFNQNKTKFIDRFCYNEYASNINLDCIIEYINKNEKFSKIKCHSFQIIFKVNTNFNLTSFNIRILDENNNKIGSINSSCKVLFKNKDKDKEEFLCNKECQNVMISINDEIKDFIKNYKCKPDLFLKDDKPKQVILIDDKPIKSNKLDLNNDVLDKNNDCLSIPICINIKDEEVEISKTLDRYSIIDIISKI